MKKLLTNKYNLKNLGKVKIIIRWQVTRDMAASIMKINQSSFVRDLIIEEKLTDYNANIIPMKAKSVIKISDPKDYNETY